MRIRRKLVAPETFPCGGKVATAKPLTNEGLGDFDFWVKTMLRSTSLVNPSSVSSYLADSFPPRGKLKGMQPECLAKACCLGNLPLWGEGGNGKAVDG